MLGERGLCVIERRARNAEGERRFHDRSTCDAMPTQHLVAGLQKIPCVEERVVLEQRIDDRFGVRVERSTAVQFGCLGIDLPAPYTYEPQEKNQNDVVYYICYASIRGIVYWYTCRIVIFTYNYRPAFLFE